MPLLLMPCPLSLRLDAEQVLNIRFRTLHYHVFVVGSSLISNFQLVSNRSRTACKKNEFRQNI